MLTLFEALPALAALQFMAQDIDAFMDAEDYDADYVDGLVIELANLEELARVVNEGKPSHLTSVEWVRRLKDHAQRYAFLCQ